MSLPANVTALVLDIETVVDGRLVQRVKWPSEPELTPTQDRERLAAELRDASEGKTDFIPHVFHVLISTAKSLSLNSAHPSRANVPP